MSSIHTREQHSGTKTNEVHMRATTWTDLQNTMLSERSQSQKTMCYMIAFV